MTFNRLSIFRQSLKTTNAIINYDYLIGEKSDEQNFLGRILYGSK